MAHRFGLTGHRCLVEEVEAAVGMILGNALQKCLTLEKPSTNASEPGGESGGVVRNKDSESADHSCIGTAENDTIY